ncbi:MAG: hypothetical protein KKF33_19115, partial [Alphaproteobacteria bacterium]|nr:hypothetical protein [Alphaproteobacteria bacterium]
EAATIEEAGQILRGLGITHVQVPDYFIPPLYATKLGDLLTDGRQATLIHDDRGYQIYSLHAPERNATMQVAGSSPSFAPWTRSQSSSLPGLRRFASLDTEGAQYEVGAQSVGASPFGLFNRDFVTRLQSSEVDRRALPDDRVVKASITLSGVGFVQIWAVFDGAPSVRLAELVLAPGVEKTLQRLVTLPENTQKMSFAIDHPGNSAVTLAGATLSRP